MAIRLWLSDTAGNSIHYDPDFGMCLKLPATAEEMQALFENMELMDELTAVVQLHLTQILEGVRALDLTQ
jgi:hypothetical protein